MKCLIIDDSIIDQLTLELIFSDYKNFETQFVSTPEQFFNAITETQYNLFLIDINLNSNITGIELAKTINTTTSWVIFCSAASCEQYYSAYKSFSFRKLYFQKPIDEYNLRIFLDSLSEQFQTKIS